MHELRHRLPINRSWPAVALTPACAERAHKRAVAFLFLSQLWAKQQREYTAKTNQRNNGDWVEKITGDVSISALILLQAQTQTAAWRAWIQMWGLHVKKIKKNKNAISNNGNKPHTPPSFCVYEINNVRNIRTPWKHCRYAAAAWFPYGLCITPSTFWIKYSRDHTTCRAGKKTQRYSSTEQRSKGGRERGSEGERESRNTRAAPVN